MTPTRILNLSDLHFGLHRVSILDELVARVNAAAPDLIAVTGDLTHRGRGSDYDAARAFLDRLNAPWLAIPGNHDVPLYNVLMRLAAPYRGWHRAIGRELAPACRIGGVQVIGVNTVDPLAWQRGLITPETVDAILARLDTEAVNLILLHHPLQQRPEVTKELMKGAPEALARLTEAGAQIALTGHLHVWTAGDLGGRPSGLLQIQAGTALCDRLGDRQNEFALLDIAGDDLTITRHIAPMGQDGGFTSTAVQKFSRTGGLWRERPAGEAARP